MTYGEALEYISSVGMFGSKPGLERISAILDKLGNPQDGLKYVHIAGTNGKGSCAAMTASVLKAAGYRTGLYTSPHLLRINERYAVNGEQIDDDVFAELVERLRPVCDAMEDHPTEFEMMTALAFMYFAQEKCDIVVLEVGMGGQLDATNIIRAPEVAVIMNIGLDHTQYLGDTPEKIAAEKAGIIKPGCDCVLYGQSAGVESVIEGRCMLLDVPVHRTDFSSIGVEFDTIEGQVFTYRGNPYALSLLGAHQRRNAAAAIETAQALRKRGFRIDDEALEAGLYSAAWPARFEILSEDPYFVADGGHNPQCALTVAENLKTYFPDMRRVLLIGVLADKDYPAMTDILDTVADEYVCVTPDSHRALPAEELAAHLEKYGKPVLACQDIKEAVHAAALAAGEDGMVCSVGSLYMSGPIRLCFGLH